MHVFLPRVSERRAFATATRGVSRLFSGRQQTPAPVRVDNRGRSCPLWRLERHSGSWTIYAVNVEISPLSVSVCGVKCAVAGSVRGVFDQIVAE